LTGCALTVKPEARRTGESGKSLPLLPKMQKVPGISCEAHSGEHPVRCDLTSTSTITVTHPGHLLLFYRSL